MWQSVKPFTHDRIRYRPKKVNRQNVRIIILFELTVCNDAYNGQSTVFNYVIGEIVGALDGTIIIIIIILLRGGLEPVSVTMTGLRLL